MKISLIVPMYNAENEIEQTLESIFDQTHQNFELILIDDGSTDDSLNLCQKYKEQHENIVLLSIENSGPGFARNVGLDEVTGDYLTFVDADDYLAPNFLEEMISIAVEKDYDIVSSHYYRVGHEITEARTNFTSGVVNKYGTTLERERYKQFKTSSTFGYVWGKLYKTTFIQKYRIRFSEEKRVFLEDTLFNLKVIAFQPHYYVYNEPLYYYNVYEESLSNRTEDITERVIQLLENYEDFLNETGKYHENLDLFILLTNRVIAWSLFKTMADEYSFKNILDKIRIFSSNQTVQRIVNHSQAFQELRKIDSRLQILLYSFLTLAIRHKVNRLLSLFFFLNYPLFAVYIKKEVRA